MNICNNLLFINNVIKNTIEKLILNQQSITKLTKDLEHPDLSAIHNKYIAICVVCQDF